MDLPIFAAYTGSSMNPTLIAPLLLEISPYAGKDFAKPGDVILFQPAGRVASGIVHRVIRITPYGLVTRGDNNHATDAHIVTAAEITGKVIAAQRGKVRQVVHGAWLGLAWHYFLRGWHIFDPFISRIFHIPYHVLAHSGIVRKLIPSRWQPRIMLLQKGRVMLLGTYVIGWYNEKSGAWNIRRPFRVLCEPIDRIQVINADNG